MSVEPAIDIAGLTVDYKKSDGSITRAVKDVSLHVYPGEIVSIVGPSGCGKTSILRAVLNEIEFTGSCRLTCAREGDLSYLQQSPALLPWRTALENAALGQEVRGRISPDSILRVEELLIDFGLGGATMSAYPDELSTGMRQRVAIARALESSPRVLLCDEPFSAIDFINRLKLNHIFKERCSARVAVLMVTHNIDEAIFLSSRVHVLSGSPGKQAAMITPKFSNQFSDGVEMRKQPEFERYFRQIWEAMESHENM